MQPARRYRRFDQKQQWISHIVPWRTSASNPGVSAIFGALLSRYFIVSTSSIFMYPFQSLLLRRKFHPENISSPPPHYLPPWGDLSLWSCSEIPTRFFSPVMCVDVERFDLCGWLWNDFCSCFVHKECWFTQFDGFCVFNFDVFGLSRRV